MNYCVVCQSPGNYSCECSSDIINLCHYHLDYHRSHPELTFHFTTQLFKQQQDLIQAFLIKKTELKVKENELSQSEENLIKGIKEKFLEVKIKIVKAQNDIDSIILILKSLSTGIKYPASCLTELLINKDLPGLDFIFRLKDCSKETLRKFVVPIGFDSCIENLNSNSEMINYDPEILQYEGSKSDLRETILKIYEPQYPDQRGFAMHIVWNNMNKRQFHSTEFKSSDDVKLYDINALVFDYSKKAHRFYFRNSEIDDQNFKKIIQALSKLDKINCIDFRHTIENDEQFELVINAFKTKKYLKHIIMKGNLAVDDKLDKLLLSFLGYAERIRTINIAYNFISINGSKILNSHLPNFRNIRDLNISSNDIGPNGAALLQPSLYQLKYLEELNIKSNNLKPEGIDTVMKAVCFLPHLSILNIANNEGFDEGALIIANYLKYMKILMVIFIDIMISPETDKLLCVNSNAYTKIIKSDGSKSKIILKNPDFSGLI